jgi:HEAT repeat protein
VFSVPESLDERIIGQPVAPRTSFRMPSATGSALAQERSPGADALVAALGADDAAVRRNAREGLVGLGVAAVPAMIGALHSNPSDYRVKSGVISGLADMLRKDEGNRGHISQALTQNDLAVLQTATSDADPTVRLQATEFLYRLKDPRSADAALTAIRQAGSSDAGSALNNSALVLKGVYPNLRADEQTRVLKEIDAAAPASSATIKRIINPQ